ncbi:hypothetical protein KCU89_g9, partial [Aureobasidium melanogenum]
MNLAHFPGELSCLMSLDVEHWGMVFTVEAIQTPTTTNETSLMTSSQARNRGSHGYQHLQATQVVASVFSPHAPCRTSKSTHLGFDEWVKAAMTRRAKSKGRYKTNRDESVALVEGHTGTRGHWREAITKITCQPDPFNTANSKRTVRPMQEGRTGAGNGSMLTTCCDNDTNGREVPS